MEEDFDFNLPKYFNQYKIIKNIGSGSMGNVFMVNDSKKKHDFACKVVKREILNNKENLMAFEQELRIHQRIKHPNIAEIHEVLYFPQYIVIIMELGSKGDLLNFMTKDQAINYGNIKKIFKDIVNGVSYLHSLNIAHGDIKPENIIVCEDYNTKIVDLGSCEASDSYFFSNHGTLIYSSPEILMGLSEDRKKSDIWSLGILLFVMFTNYFPWLSENDEDIVEEIKKGVIPFHSSIPNNAYELIKKCTNLDPSLRPSCEEILNHHWLCINNRFGKDIKSYNTISMAKVGGMIIRPTKKQSQSLSSFSIITETNKKKEKSTNSILFQ